jgi:hypothetical protein
LAGTYPAGAFTANVAGNPSLTFSNASPVVLAGGAQTLLGVVMQASSVGPTATINPSTLTVITTPVTGWTSITNPTAQSQIGAFSELDAAYLPRQAQNLAAQGSCTAPATGAALRALGSAQTPPQTLSVSVLENRTNAPLVVSGILMPANTYAPVIYDGGTGWAAANPTLIAASIYANKPAGITSTGSTSSVIADPFLGNQSVFWTLPSSLPLFISVTVVPLSGIVFANLVIAIQSALVAAAVAPTTSSGIPPVGQLVPGAAVIGSQLETVIQNVPGVTDVQAITFGFSASPVNTLPLSLTASQVATLLASTIATNVIVTQGVGP